MRTRSRRSASTAAVLVVCLLAAACSGQSSDAPAPDPTTAPTSGPATESASGSARPDQGARAPADLAINVTSTSSRAADLRYPSPYGTGALVSDFGRLPASLVSKGVGTLPDGWSLTARQSGSGRLACTVTLGAQTIAQDAASGPGATVTCMP